MQLDIRTALVAMLEADLVLVEADAKRGRLVCDDPVYKKSGTATELSFKKSQTIGILSRQHYYFKAFICNLAI